MQTYELRPVGWVRSPLTDRGAAPKQGDEGAPPARIVVRPELAEAMADLTVGATVIVLTWLHEGDRSVLSVHPRDDVTRPRTGVFSTRSQDRPNRSDCTSSRSRASTAPPSTCTISRPSTAPR